MSLRDNSYLDALNAALDSLTKLQVSIQLVSQHLAAIQRQTKDYNLEFDRQGNLSRVTYRHSGEEVWNSGNDESDYECLELRSNCEWLPKYVKSLWEAHPAADNALALLPLPLIEKLNALTDSPWLAKVRHDCLDRVLAWPGDPNHQTTWAALKVGGRIDEMLKHAALLDPFTIWGQYQLFLLDYKRQLIAIRDAVQPSTIPESGNAEVNGVGGKMAKRPREIDRATEARDKWIYDECHRGTLYDTIAIRLNKKPKTWVRITTKQGIRSAAERYAKRHNLPAIPPRQAPE